MGGKRPDQYRIDPDEGGTTDYKFYPEVPGDTKRGRQLYGRIMKSARKSQPVPPDVTEPTAALERAEELERQEHVHEEGKGGESGG